VTVADTAAVQSKIEAVPILADATTVTFWPSGKPPTTPPWVVVFPAEGNDSSDRLTGPLVTTNPSFTLHIVGATAAQVQTVTGLVKEQFVTGGRFAAPIVTGRLNQGGYWRAPLPLQVDTSVTPNIAFQVIELGWVSDPV
jgi:hypothetical protein